MCVQEWDISVVHGVCIQLKYGKGTGKACKRGSTGWHCVRLDKGGVHSLCKQESLDGPLLTNKGRQMRRVYVVCAAAGAQGHVGPAEDCCQAAPKQGAGRIPGHHAGGNTGTIYVHVLCDMYCSLYSCVMCSSVMYSSVMRSPV
jgi:hypothetical protein